MLRPKTQIQVYLYAGGVDMRKSIDGLAALVEQELDLSPMSDALFFFVIEVAIKSSCSIGSAMVLCCGISAWRRSASPD